jgi:hypothetical protein
LAESGFGLDTRNEERIAFYEIFFLLSLFGLNNNKVAATLSTWLSTLHYLCFEIKMELGEMVLVRRKLVLKEIK